jgi:hypothetical protein
MSVPFSGQDADVPCTAPGEQSTSLQQLCVQRGVLPSAYRNNILYEFLIPLMPTACQTISFSLS